VLIKGSKSCISQSIGTEERKKLLCLSFDFPFPFPLAFFFPLTVFFFFFLFLFFFLIRPTVIRDLIGPK